VACQWAVVTKPLDVLRSRVEIVQVTDMVFSF
jgi:hypothetical protein